MTRTIPTAEEALRHALREKAFQLRLEADALLNNTAGSVRKYDKIAMAHWLEVQAALGTADEEGTT